MRKNRDDLEDDDDDEMPGRRRGESDDSLGESSREEDVEEGYVEDEDEPAEETGKQKLGRVQSIFRRNPKVFKMYFIMMGISLAAVGICLVGIVSERATPGERGGCLLGLGVFLVVDAGCVWRIYQGWSRKVLLSNRGFAVVEGSRRKVYHWDDIVEQYQQITPTFTTTGVTIAPRIFTPWCAPMDSESSSTNG